MLQQKTHNSTEPSASLTEQSPAQLAPQPELKKLPQVQPGNKERFQQIAGAGSVVFRRRGNQAEIFFLKNSYKHWTFPKGKQKLGESLVQTAIRETKEETGLTGLRFVAPVGRTVFRYRRSGTLIQKAVHFFLFEAASNAKEVMTGVEGGIWEAKWVPKNKALEVNGYRNLDRLLTKAIAIIAQRERRNTYSQRPRQA